MTKNILWVLIFILFILWTNLSFASTDNLLTNPSFEEGGGGWQAYPATVTLHLDSFAHSGNQSLAVFKEAAKGYGYAYQEVPVAAGEYVFSGWVRWVDETISKVKLRVELYDWEGGKLGSTLEVEPLVRQAAFQLLELSFPVATGSAQARVEAYVYQQKPDPSTPALFDDLLLKLVEKDHSPEPPLVFPQNISLSEFLPNPVPGENEWVELYNGNRTSTELHQWLIDDLENGGGVPIVFTATPSAQSYFRVDLGTRSLLNNDGDHLRLLFPDRSLVEEFVYPATERGLAWAKDAFGQWQLTTTPTPGQPNQITAPLKEPPPKEEPPAPPPTEPPAWAYQVSLSEFMPQPPAKVNEWVEIKNSNSFLVVLENWQIDDGEGGGRPVTCSLSLPSGAYAQIDLGTRSLLNNTGDEVRLLHPLGVIESMSYSSSAPEVAWAKNKKGNWKPTTTPTPGAANVITSPPKEEPSPDTDPPPVATPQNIFLTEFMPNPPAGENEWVELYNANQQAVELRDWRLDDNPQGGQAITFSVSLGPAGYARVDLGTRSLLNNAGDEVRLLYPDGSLADKATYSSSTQGHTWAKAEEGTWQLTTTPTPGAVNRVTPPASGSNTEDPEEEAYPEKVDLSEFMPAPPVGENEWVELFNHNQFAVSLKDWQIDDQAGGGSPKKFSAELVGRSYLVVDLGTRALLNNGGDEVRLLRPDGLVVASFRYEESAEGVAWARDSQGQWQLTTTPTPGKQNLITRPEPAQGSDNTQDPLDDAPSQSVVVKPEVRSAAVVSIASAQTEGEISPEAWSDERRGTTAAEKGITRYVYRRDAERKVVAAAINSSESKATAAGYLRRLQLIIGTLVVLALVTIGGIYARFTGTSLLKKF